MLGAVPGWDSSPGLTAATTAVPPATLLPFVEAPAFIYCAKDNASFTLRGASPRRCGAGGLGLGQEPHPCPAAGPALGWLGAGLSLFCLSLPKIRIFSSVQPPCTMGIKTFHPQKYAVTSPGHSVSVCMRAHPLLLPKPSAAPLPSRLSWALVLYCIRNICSGSCVSGPANPLHTPRGAGGAVL